MSPDEISQIVHEISRAFCEAHNDHSLKPWNETSDDLRAVVMKEVIFHMTHEDAGAEATHERWMSSKIEQGWKFGPEKNTEKKEHPSLIPFSELSHYEQVKDVLVVATIKSLLPHLS